MEIFLANLPPRATEKHLKKTIRPLVEGIGAKTFDLSVFRNKTSGTLTLPTEEFGLLFLAKYESSRTVFPSGKSRHTGGGIKILGSTVRCQRSKNLPDRHLVRSLLEDHIDRLEENGRLTFIPNETKASLENRKFEVSALECGIWDVHENAPTTFDSFYKTQKAGEIIFGRDGVRIYLNDDETPDDELFGGSSWMMQIPYDSIRSIVVGEPGKQVVTFTCETAPRFYHKKGGLGQMLSEMGLLGGANGRGPSANKRRDRISSLDEQHALIAAFCFVYRCTLKVHGEQREIQKLGGQGGIRPIEHVFTNSRSLVERFISDFSRLVPVIRLFEFPVAFQLQAMLANGVLPPGSILGILEDVSHIVRTLGSKKTADVLMKFILNMDYPNPENKETGLSPLSLRIALGNCVKTFLATEKTKGKLRSHLEDTGNLTLIHHAYITPAGCYFDGPLPETQNRVLRDYPEHHDYFLRVTLSEENGEQLSYERDVSQDLIYERFKEYLNESSEGTGGKLIIGDRVFSFLGFSGASLRSHTCWFMAPFVCNGKMMDANTLIEALGDFSHIRSPGRCAARIGQAFSNTMNSVHVPISSERVIPDIERLDKEGNKRCFTDGCGKISKEMVNRIWRESQNLGALHPCVFQIRFAGAKGVVSLDTQLQGDQLCLRKSMIKFEGSNARNIEICSSAVKPLPMYLNRPLIKILEDLHIDEQVFLDLQTDEVNTLQQAAQHPLLGANFMKCRNIGQGSLKLPWVLEAIYHLGFSFQEDEFLGQAFELALMTALRDIKYRARIQVRKGYTLMGCVDETGILQEDEIFCRIESEEEEGIVTGQIVITRAPAMHPGDVQVVTAVAVPRDSPLQALRNVVVFSQYGERDMPSQLSGGDLDGDLYNLIYDTRFYPKRLSSPASYPRVQEQTLDRPVKTADMVDFLLDFMQNDRLGLISIRHLMIADREPSGTFHPDCIKLAEMHSSAVDFPKTGIPVKIDQLPKIGKSRPDFMAPGPHVFIEKGELQYQEEDKREEDVDDEDDLAPMRYYRSEKVLGKLYRAIDEEGFSKQIHKPSKKKTNLLEDIWKYAECCIPIDFDWAEHINFAIELKASYDDHVSELMRNRSPTPWSTTLKEVEVFIGCIIGRGRQNRRQKDASISMKEEFEKTVTWVIDSIKADSPSETLARGMACLSLCAESARSIEYVGNGDGASNSVGNSWAEIHRRMANERNKNVGGGESLKSFGWVAASVVLQEIDKLQKIENRKKRRNQSQKQ